MEEKHLQFLTKLSDLLSQEIEVDELSDKLKSLLSEFVEVEKLNLYVYDSVTNTLRNCAKNWCILEDKDLVYEAFADVHGNDFVINSKACKLPSAIGEMTLKIKSLYIPIHKNSQEFGIIEFGFNTEVTVRAEFLQLMKIFASQISLKIQNIVLSEQSKINVDFHDSMKNIAKIIETQYELSYIVPIIGEMLDRFISDHLIYVFLKQEDEFKLVWPKACKDERIFESINMIDNDTNFLLTNNDKIGVFPLAAEGEITGCIVARSTLDALSKRDISYLEQLTRQASITINRAEAYSKVLQYATLDALTNLNNRRQFEVRLKQEIAGSKRQNTPLCAMMIDIDFFKRVNDTYGHASGDTVLRTVATIIKETLRESDIPSRYGGEEFAVLLPFTHLKEAQIVGERLRQAVEARIIPIDNKNINVTISMGLAEFSMEETGEKLFERADAALYEAKTSGRNKICIDKNVKQ